jgi:glucose-1-phosphate adenylyltransferase
MKDTIGLINMQVDSPLKELNEDRPLAAMPFAGKFRLMDFVLSGMVNAGIETVGLMLPRHARPVLDHVRSGKEWNLAHKDDGLFYLPMEVDEIVQPVTGDIGAYYRNLRFVEAGSKKYLVLSYCRNLHNIDYDRVLHFHRQHNADVTLVCKKQTDARPGQAYVVKAAADGRITGIAEKDSLAAGDNLFMEALLIDCGIFTRSVRQAYAQGKESFFLDVLGAELKRLRVFGYPYSSYAARITSIRDYYKASMDLLNVDNLRTVFKPGLHIRTKIKDEAPAKYMEEAQVKNSIIANGCIIEGRVENSILFRNVRVGKNACVQNSIVMQRAVIGEDAQVDCVICDKNVLIQPEAVLQGNKDKPLCIAKYGEK